MRIDAIHLYQHELPVRGGPYTMANAEVSSLTTTLVELGVDPTARDEIAADAVREPPAAGNPRPFTAELAAEIFDAACSGP